MSMNTEYTSGNTSGTNLDSWATSEPVDTSSTAPVVAPVMGLDSMTGRPSDGSTMSGAQKDTPMVLDDYKALQNQVVLIGEGNMQLGLLLTDIVVRIAHLSGLDPAAELTAEKEAAEKLAADEKEAAEATDEQTTTPDAQAPERTIL
jgi:hypothetical protein